MPEAVSPVWWEDPNFLGENKLGPRPERDHEVLVDLDGGWRFRWYGWPGAAPAGFEHPEVNDSDWAEIPIPSCVETLGYGQLQYVNVRYPFPADPPHIPHDQNPTLHYRRRFVAPAFEGQARLRFEGVDSAFTVWINGVYVGRSKDSKDPAEFDVTAFLRSGENVIAVEVLKWCDGSYLEDQDMWRFSGIFRSVSIIRLPPARFESLAWDGDFDPETGEGTLTVWCEAVGQPEGARIRALLSDHGGPIGEATCAPGEPIRLQFRDARPWSAESPHLYEARYQLEGPDGRVLDEVQARPGFRRVTWQDGVFRINGRAVKLLGVNRHEHHPVTGRTITVEQMRQDVCLMKSLNVNCVRCSHYPNQAAWYRLCDEYGLYVIDEANIESHGMGYDPAVSLGNDPRWEAAHLDRIRRMVVSHRNHPSVVVWSMGNEAGPGCNFRAGAELIHQLDPTRPVHYERDNTVTDVVSVMYPTVDEVNRAGQEPEGRPFFVCEYAHAMGNACGDLDAYVAAFRSHPRNMGGCIWDFVDQSIWASCAEPPGHFEAYGGDFDDDPNDGAFSCDGIVRAGREMTPKAWEVKACYQPATFRLVDSDTGRVDVRNHHAFTNLSQYRATAKVTVDGCPVATWSLPALDVPPGEARTFDFAVPPTPTGERHLSVSLTLRQETTWAPAGTEVARGQLALAAGPELPHVAIAPGPTAWTVSDSGELRLELDGRAVIEAGPVLSVFRAYTDNDEWLRRDFEASGLRSLRALNVVARRVGPEAWVESDVVGPRGRGFRQRTHFVERADGSVAIETAVEPLGDLPPLLRVGWRLALPASFDRMTWLGRGPHESYPDRKQSADFGLYAGSVDDQYTPYPRPQENGNKEDVRWAALQDAAGYGLIAVGDGPLSVGASRFSADQLDQSRHRNGERRRRIPLVPDSVVHFTLDHRQSGLGGASCGPPPRDAFIIRPGPIAWRVLLRPVRPGDDLSELAYRTPHREIRP